MKAILIHLPEEVADLLNYFAEKKGWNRKQYIQWQLTYHTKITKTREDARKSGNAELRELVIRAKEDRKYLTPKK